MVDFRGYSAGFLRVVSRYKYTTFMQTDKKNIRQGQKKCCRRGGIFLFFFWLKGGFWPVGKWLISGVVGALCSSPLLPLSLDKKRGADNKKRVAALGLRWRKRPRYRDKKTSRYGKTTSRNSGSLQREGRDGGGLHVARGAVHAGLPPRGGLSEHGEPTG